MKSIKINDDTYQQLKITAAKSSAYLYEIVDMLITQERDTIKALHHAVRRNHNYSPASCADCGFIHKLFERYVVNRQRAAAKNGKKGR